MIHTRWIGWMASGLVVSVSVLPAVAQVNSTSLMQLFPALVGVPLTSSQQLQLQRLSDQTLPQLQKLLTSAQQAQFEQGLAEGKGVRSSVLSLNLSAMQRLQILNLLQTTRSQLATILTPSQQQQVQRNLKTLQQSSR